MKKLSRGQAQEKADHVAKLNATAEEVRSAIEKFNAHMSDEWVEVEAAVNAHNEAIRDASEFCGTIAADAQAYADERSERWAESDAGQAHSEWVSEWEGGLEEIELDAPSDVEEPEMEAAERLENLADQA
jgi:hypothetical protein